MKFILASVVAAGLMIAGGAMAAEMPDLAKKNGCIVCHSIDKKALGPTWTDVAKKYKGDAGAEATLITRVTKGGVGVWGKARMPAMDPAGKKQEDIKQLVQFILSLDK